MQAGVDARNEAVEGGSTQTAWWHLLRSKALSLGAGEEPRLLWQNCK